MLFTQNILTQLSWIRTSWLFLALIILASQQACGSSTGSGTSTSSSSAMIGGSSSAMIPPTQKPYVINRVKYYPIPSSSGYVETGIASWYGPDFHGRLTSNGEQYNMYSATAAHKLLPMNTIMLVKNLENGREEVVRINDRGPFVQGRIVDLSYSTAKKLDILNKGTSKVTITALSPGHTGSQRPPRINYQKGDFYVQIGSFLDKKNALRLQKKFTTAGHQAVVQSYSSPKKIYYRVQVFAGHYLKKARNAERSLLKHGYKGAFLIAR